MVLHVSSLSKAYGHHDILRDISFSLVAGQRLGVVGANGVGKSTLLKIVAGLIEADGGTIQWQKGIQPGYLTQALTVVAGKTIDHLVSETLADILQMENRLRELEFAMSHAEGADLDIILREYGDLTEKFEEADGYDISSKKDIIWAGLGIDYLTGDRLLESLSGGEKSRMALAMLLLQSPDVLLLDEPTNHLDSVSLAWLEDYLKSYRGAMLIVSHDRYFLNELVNEILEIDEYSRTAKHYSGNYDAYFAEKQLERIAWERDYARQQEELKDLQFEYYVGSRRNLNYRAPSDGDKISHHSRSEKHQATVSKKVRVVEEKLKRLHEDMLPKPPDPLVFEGNFDPAALDGRYKLEASHLCHRFGDRVILDDLSFHIKAGDRLAIVGPNGSGKSTLLKILVGSLAPDRGVVGLGSAVRIGYLSQDALHGDPRLSAFEVLAEELDDDEQRLKSLLISGGLFRYEDLAKPFGNLSVGQQRKIQIARLIAMKANLLILDEPTNDVSFDVLENLEAALKAFPGAVITATHDRRFLQYFGGEIWHMANGQLLADSTYA